jgi:hypothetical protein
VALRKRDKAKVTATSLLKGRERLLTAFLRRKDISDKDKSRIEIKLALTTDRYKF